jgi:hypothetical protein
MIDITPADHRSDENYPFLDMILRDALPEIKLALGETIDRENARALPGRYAKLLPETLLIVTLRPDAGEALGPVAGRVERDLTDSCSRHGSLYDRVYRVQLRRSEDPDAPLYRVAAHAGRDLASEAGRNAGSDDAGSAGPDAASAGAAVAQADLPAVRADRGGDTEAAPLTVDDPDATRIEDVGPPGWQPGRWVLVVEDEAGEEREAFRLTDPFTTIGRRTDDPRLSSTVALSDVPHMSRRQLAFLWEERDGAPGFRIFNLGLNPVHLPSLEVPGAHLGKGTLDLAEVADENTGWLPPGVPLRIGDHGPILRVDEVPDEPEDEEVDDDPDATQFG